MKGIKHQSNFDTVRILKDNLIFKSLPYGKWTTLDNKEFLFNRDYEPIAGWDINRNVPIPTMPKMWIDNIDSEQTIMYYGGLIEYPTTSELTLRKCWDVLADWSNRAALN